MIRLTLGLGTTDVQEAGSVCALTLCVCVWSSANAAKELLVPYFLPVIDSLKGFLTNTRDEMRSLQTQALGETLTSDLP